MGCLKLAVPPPSTAAALARALAPLPLRQHHTCSSSPNPKGTERSLLWGAAAPQHARPRNRAGLSILPAWGMMGWGFPVGQRRPKPLGGCTRGVGRGPWRGRRRRQPLHVRGQAAKPGQRENKTLFPSVRSRQSNDTRRPQQRRPCLSATRPRGEGGRRRRGGGVCVGLFAGWIIFSFCAKRIAPLFWERFPGPLGCRVCWRHIWPELFLSVQVENGRISTQTAGSVWLKPCACCLVQSPRPA